MSQSLKILITLKNASMARKEKVTIDKPTQSMCNIIALLYSEGLVQSFFVEKSSNRLIIFLRYSFNKDVFRSLKLFSKSTTSSYFTYKDICKLSNKRFLLIFSTSKGFLTSLDCKNQHLGGKLCFIC